MNKDFTTVTELPGEDASREQIERLTHRYCWAAEFCAGRDVLELACGAGQGLGVLASVAASVSAGDLTESFVRLAHRHYGDRIQVCKLDAEVLPFGDCVFDVVILFEAIYYLGSAEKFAKECRRVLRPGGHVLIVTANKDLYDFNPSPFSRVYLGVSELNELFVSQGFSCSFFGVTPIDGISVRQRLLRPVKFLAVKLGVMPKTMARKRLLKRLVFGPGEHIPAEVTRNAKSYDAPMGLMATVPDRRFKVIYLAAALPASNGASLNMGTPANIVHKVKNEL